MTINQTTRCIDCGNYYSVKIHNDNSIEQWVGGDWVPMPDEKVENLAIPDYQTKYTCWMCKKNIRR